MSYLQRSLEDSFRGARCLITGGLGFIGSNLAHRLVALGAEVTILDALLPAYGGNLFNIESIRARIELVIGDVRDADCLARVTCGQDYVFSLAGQIGHLDSMDDPLNDLSINAEGPLRLLEACRSGSPLAKVLYASTRQVYGRPRYLPVDEEHPLQPIDCNAVSNLAAEFYHRIFSDAHGLRTTCLRLTNTYGPRQMMKDGEGRYAFLYFFLRRALEGQTLRIMGGTQLRDYTYIDDAVDALILAAARDESNGRIYNLGGEAATHWQLAQLLLDAVGGGTLEQTMLPPERALIEVGQVQLDCSRIERELGWRPRWKLAAGLAETVAYYREHREHYWHAERVHLRHLADLFAS